MQFIKLTAPDDTPVWINTAKIALLRRAHRETNAMSYIDLGDNADSYQGVKETVEEIFVILKREMP